MNKYHKPIGVTYKFFMWTMFAMAVIGMIAAVLF